MKYLITLILLLNFFPICAQNVVFVVIDGARYAETFGDTTYSHIPHMSQIASQGAYLDEMYNEHQTKTIHGVPALWTGSWEGSYDITYEGKETQATYMPSVFEYFRKQKNADASQCFHTLKGLESLWLQSFHVDYGPDYWPTTISSGSTDTDVLNETLEVIDNHHPQFLWVYLADVDKGGHTGDWDTYISAIKTADEIVHTIWTTIQNDPVYKDKTTMFVTNDHGRHDDDVSTGFKGHGCSCKGCRQIMFLAVGKGIKEGYVSTTHHELADAPVTASYSLDINPVFASGKIISEIFESTVAVFPEASNTVPKISVNQTGIKLELEKSDRVTMEIFDIMGRRVDSVIKNKLIHEAYYSNFDQSLSNGIYIVKVQYGSSFISRKFVIC